MRPDNQRDSGASHRHEAVAMRLKEKALARVASTKARPGRYKPDDVLLSFLESL